MHTIASRTSELVDAHPAGQAHPESGGRHNAHKSVSCFQAHLGRVWLGWAGTCCGQKIRFDSFDNKSKHSMFVLLHTLAVGLLPQFRQVSFGTSGAVLSSSSLAFHSWASKDDKASCRAGSHMSPHDLQLTQISQRAGLIHPKTDIWVYSIWFTSDLPQRKWSPR